MRFRRLLVVALVLFQAATVVTILALSQVGTQTAMLEQARHILKNATGESVEHTTAFLDNAERAVSAGATLFTSAVLGARPEDREQLENYFIALLEHHDPFAGMYLGTVDGAFLYVSRDKSGALPYRVKRIEAPGTGARLWHRDAQHERSTGHHDADDSYDARSRPWFRAALARDGLVWTEPYVFFTARKLGITAAMPVRSADGAVLGVIGVDLELDDLAQFLGHLDIGASGSAFVASADGVLIAAPFAGESPQLASTDMRHGLPPSIATVADLAGREALETVRVAQQSGSGDRHPTFLLAGREYLVEYLPLVLADGRRWVVGTFAPADEFLVAMRAHERRSMSVALGVLAVSMLAGWFLASTAWSPVVALHDQANRDQLTQVFNRRYVDRHAEELFATAEAEGRDIAAVIIDIDHFKHINDTHGHAVGDEVIRETARRLRSAARIGDIVARIGGEEFLLLLPTAPASVALTLTERIRSWFADAPVGTAAGPLVVTFSAGVAVQGERHRGFEAVRAAADGALYEAKRTGRNRVVVAAQKERPRDGAEVSLTVVSGAAAAQQPEDAQA